MEVTLIGNQFIINEQLCKGKNDLFFILNLSNNIFNFQPPSPPPIHLIRTLTKIIPDQSVSVTLVSFFQNENVNKGLLPFKTYFFKTYLTPLKLLEAKAFNARLEASLS